MKSFIEAQFGYCPLVWMFQGRVLNRKINHLHQRSLKIVYKDSISSFHELLLKGHSFAIHHRNVQNLAIERYKIKENLSDVIISSIFPPRLIKCNLWTQSDFFGNCVNSSKYGLNSIRFSASKVWEMITMEMNNLTNLGHVNLLWQWDNRLTVRIRKFCLISSAKKYLLCRHLSAWSPNVETAEGSEVGTGLGMVASE